MLLILLFSFPMLVPGTASTWTDGAETWAGNPYCAEAMMTLKADSPAIDYGVVIPGFHCPQPGSALSQARQNDGFNSYCVEWYGVSPDARACEFVPQSPPGLEAPTSLTVSP